MALLSRASSLTLPLLIALGAATSTLLSSPARALTADQVNPVYLSANDESQSGLDAPVGNSPASFAYYFDTTSDKHANALGLFTVNDWTPQAGGTSFDVILYQWAYDGTSTTFSELTRTTFNQADTASYVTKSNYYWLPIQSEKLERSDLDPNAGYVVTAVGNFSTASGLPYFYGGSGIFAPGFVYDGNGLNIDSADNPDYAGTFPDPYLVGEVAGQPTFGYFNANVSYVVPGPLPVVGAGVALGWSRRLRRRLSA
jgi:hypothetical protein